MENPIKMDDLGGKTPYFWFNTHIPTDQDPKTLEDSKNLSVFSIPSLHDGRKPARFVTAPGLTMASQHAKLRNCSIFESLRIQSILRCF